MTRAAEFTHPGSTFRSTAELQIRILCEVHDLHKPPPQIWEIICNFIAQAYHGLSRTPNSGNHQVQNRKIKAGRPADCRFPTPGINPVPPP